MGAGKFDRRIIIERSVTETNDFGEEIETWAELSRVWAGQKFKTGFEGLAAQEYAGTETITFCIRYMPDLTTRDRVRFKHHGSADERIYNITKIREIGRGIETEVDAVARNDGSI